MALLQDRRDTQFEPPVSHAEPVLLSDLIKSQCVPKITDPIPSQDVPLAILERRIQKEKDPEKQRALQKELDNIKKTRNEIERTMHKIAEYSCGIRAPEALKENRPLTRLKDMKEVSEHFMKTFSEWHEGQDIGFVLSQEQLFVNLIESGLKIDKIKMAITQAAGPVNPKVQQM